MALKKKDKQKNKALYTTKKLGVFPANVAAISSNQNDTKEKLPHLSVDAETIKGNQEVIISFDVTFYFIFLCAI